jgi:hypothetical protein
LIVEIGGNQVENRPIITISGRSIPPEMEEKYDNWTEGLISPFT